MKNLAFLSSEQALADLANFTRTMTVQYKLPAGTKWIAFGGSYPGSLAAWMRMKYPHLIHGAMSASGPLLAQIDFQRECRFIRLKSNYTAYKSNEHETIMIVYPKYPEFINSSNKRALRTIFAMDFLKRNQQKFFVAEYYVIVEDSLRQHSQACVDALAEATRLIHIMLHHPIGQQGLTKSFRYALFKIRQLRPRKKNVLTFG